MSDRHALQGFVNAHSHAFQRALRGRAGGSDFWAWRDEMLDEAERLTTSGIRREYEIVYREQRAAGYTAVGEFHYLGFDEARAVYDAAQAAAIDLVVLYAAYARGGMPRFRQESVGRYLHDVERLAAEGIRVGLAPHSVRACPREWLEEIGRYAAATRLPLHVHACEQPREIDECIAEHGLRPIELLADTGCLTEHTTVVHATHADAREVDLLSQAGAGVCLCPTTEANLGDGFAPVLELLVRRVPICIGSDSNVRIDPLEELREIDGIARRQSLSRAIVDPAAVIAMGTANGARSLALDTWPAVEVDLTHRSLRGVSPDNVLDALVTGCGADVFV